jgi:hypothetical protein
MSIVWEKYDATVTVNEDDENRGRIRVACVGLLGDEEIELPMWVEPVLEWGFFLIPNVGETVEIEAAVSSDEDEINGQFSIDNLDIRWRGKRSYTIDEPENENIEPTPIHPDFLSNYGRRRGFSTPHGHIVMFDDDPKNPTLQITFQKTAMEVGTPPEASDYSRLEFEKDGSLKVALLETTTLHLQTEGKKLKIGIDGGDSLEIAGKNSDAVAKIGDGAVSAPIAENLKNYIDNSVKIHVDGHIHPTAMGNSGTPITQMPAYDDSITSSHLKFPNG